jgi:hypothetical protein
MGNGRPFAVDRAPRRTREEKRLTSIHVMSLGYINAADPTRRGWARRSRAGGAHRGASGCGSARRVRSICVMSLGYIHAADQPPGRPAGRWVVGALGSPGERAVESG